MNRLSILNFKRLVYFSIKALLALLLSVVILNSIIFIFQEDKSTKLSLFDDNSDEFTALTIGNSHTVDFHFPSLGVSGINFYDAGGDIEEVLFKAGIILDKAKNIKQVYLPVSPGALHFSQRITNVNWQHRQSQVINNLPLSYKTFFYSQEESFRRWFKIVFPILELQKLFIKWLIPKNVFPPINVSVDASCHIPIITDIDTSEILLGSYNLSTMRSECIAEFANLTVNSHISKIDISLSSQPDLANKNVNRLLLLADKLKLVDGQLILVIPPLTREYYEDVRIQDWLPAHRRLLAHLAQHANIEVYDFHDYFYEEMDNGSNEYFFDDDHLALPGAIKFSKALKVAMDKRASEASE